MQGRGWPTSLGGQADERSTLAVLLKVHKVPLPRANAPKCKQGLALSSTASSMSCAANVTVKQPSSAQECVGLCAAAPRRHRTRSVVASVASATPINTAVHDFRYALLSRPPTCAPWRLH